MSTIDDLSPPEFVRVHVFGCERKVDFCNMLSGDGVRIRPEQITRAEQSGRFTPFVADRVAAVAENAAPGTLKMPWNDAYLRRLPTPAERAGGAQVAAE
jgi:hypothetical protein